jgi:hypothetical protein
VEVVYDRPDPEGVVKMAEEPAADERSDDANDDFPDQAQALVH